MVDTMAVLGAAASAKLAGDRLIRDIVAYIRETRFTSTPAPKPTRQRRKKARLSRPLKSTTSGLGRRPSSSRLSKKVSLMTDSELEAELESRRQRRAKERDLYSRAMRSDKLAALESELVNLRREIGRIDPISSKNVLRPGTPHSVHWEPLPKTRRSVEMPRRSVEMRPSLVPELNTTTNPTSQARVSAPSAGPPPPPPPPPPPHGGDDEGLTLDPEKRRKEKEERQRRREEKKKERQQAQKKLTLADIIRSAGADPVKRLKPATKKLADLEMEEFEKQTREREERERRQEHERIELEKKALENMGRRVNDRPSVQDEGNAKDGVEPSNSDESSDVGSTSADRSNTGDNANESEKQSKLLKDLNGAVEKQTAESDKCPDENDIAPERDVRTGQVQNSDPEDMKNSRKDDDQSLQDRKTETDSPATSKKSPDNGLQVRKEIESSGESQKSMDKNETQTTGGATADQHASTAVLDDAENIAPNASAKVGTGERKPPQKPLNANGLNIAPKP